MFERNAAVTQEQGAVAVEITLDDGTIVTGKLMVPASRAVFDVLNGPSVFFDFEPYDGERRFIAKSALKAVKLLGGTMPLGLVQKVRDLDGFDPHSVLGVKPGTEWDDVRHAYLALAKTYHPDRYGNADLPAEVGTYLSGMLRRINTAYAALELAHTSRRQAATRRQEAVYTSAPRA